MHYPEIIKTALKYIEENLKTEITAEELAKIWPIIRRTIITDYFLL